MAYSGGYRAPRLRDIVLALIMVLAALIVLLKLGNVVKITGAVLYWLPAQLGVLRQASTADVWRYDLRELPETMSFPVAGRYAVYTGDYDLLMVTGVLAEYEGMFWLVISDAATGLRAPMSYVTRGMRVYDSHLAPGRPIVVVEIPQAGLYSLKAPRRPAEIGIVRDYVTGNEGRITAVFAIEMLLLLSPLVLFLGRPYFRQWLALRARRRVTRASADAAFQRLLDKRRVQAAGEDPHALWKPKK